MPATDATEYVEIRVDVPIALADAVCDFVVENITSGLVIEEEEGAATTGVIFYLTSGSSTDFRRLLTDYLGGIVDTHSTEFPRITEQTIHDVDWLEKYKASTRPVWIGSDIVVRPGWHELQSPVKYDIIIEPKMAFGTGAHETTQSCLMMIDEWLQPGMRFLDIGTGSGILSVLADKVGASYIKAIDCDVMAVENCRENFAINKVTSAHDILFGSIDMCRGDKPYQFVCANIIKATIISILPELISVSAKDGILVLSGLLQEDAAEIEENLSLVGQEILTVHDQNEWKTYVTRRS